MIQDGIDYGEGFCRADEPGPGVDHCCLIITNSDGVVRINNYYRQPIKPKEKEVNEQYIKVLKAKNIYYQDKTLQLEVPLSEAIRLGEEAQRIKAENEIKAGDWYWAFNAIQKANIDIGCPTCDTKKIKNPTHIQALNEIYEGMK